MTPLDLPDTLVYDFHAPAAAGAGDRQAPGSGRTSAAGTKPGAFFTSRIPFYDGAIGMASAMLVSHAGSWRTLSHRRHHLFDSSDGGLQVQPGVPL